MKTKQLLKFNKYDFVNIVGITSVVAVLLLEMVVDNYLTSYCDCGGIHVMQIVFACLLIVIIIGSAIFNRKYIGKGLRHIFKDMVTNTMSGNIIDIVYIIFFLLHLTWIPDSIFDFIKSDYNCSYIVYYTHPLVFVLGLIICLYIKPTFSKDEGEDGSDIKVLFSGISFLSEYTMQAFFEPVRLYKSHMETIYVFADNRIKIDYKPFFTEQQKEKVSEDLLEMGVKQSTLDDIIKANTKNDKMTALKKFIEEIITKEFQENNIEVVVVDCDYDKIQETSDCIANKVDDALAKGCQDKHLLFNISPGTANLSVAMALNSIRGKRKCAYKEQNGEKRFLAIDLNVYKLKDIVESFFGER